MGKAGMWKIAFVLRAREWPLEVSVVQKLVDWKEMEELLRCRKGGLFLPEFMCLLSPPSVVEIGLVSRRKRGKKGCQFPLLQANPRFPPLTRFKNPTGLLPPPPQGEEEVFQKCPEKSAFLH